MGRRVPAIRDGSSLAAFANPEFVPGLRREVGLPTLEEQAEMMRPACSP
jgi:hypothetical protein